MLINSYSHIVDPKGRVFIPAKWRDDLGDTVIVTRGILGGGESKCLFGMSMSAWNDFYERFRSLALSDIRAQNVMRLLFANACECELDKQGRILVSNTLRNYAGLDKDVVLIGMGGRFEIWDAQTWEKHNDAEKDDLGEDALQHLMELGI